MHGRTGGSRERQRPAAKTLSDMRYLMNWITTTVAEAGAIEQEITISAVDWMFAVVANLFSEGECNGQKKWNMVIRALQKKS